MSVTRLGIDFGTTNSVAVLATPDGATRTLRFGHGDEPDSETCRTLLCLWAEPGRAGLQDAIGQAAIEAYLDDPGESRLIMSMKSYLAQASFRETRLLGRTMTLEALVARFLAALMRAGGIDPAAVATTVGRPVRFAGDMADDELGCARLREGFRQAGFGAVALALEPEAAGWRFLQLLDGPATVLVGDFGGGTSDFSVLRFDPSARTAVTPLGHAGVGIAGDQFDSRIIDRVVSPLLGRDGTYRIMGGETLPMPAEWYSSLSRWHRLSLMRTPATLRAIADVARHAADPVPLQRLVRLIEDQQGHALYRAVGRAKTALSQGQEGRLTFAHRDLSIDATIARSAFEAWIAPDLARLDAAIGQALDQAGLAAPAIDQVFLTGGTSFVPAVRRLFERRFGAARIAGGGEFVSVAEGLALMRAADA
jgi:hypothetical chaperone protein